MEVLSLEACENFSHFKRIFDEKSAGILLSTFPGSCTCDVGYRCTELRIKDSNNCFHIWSQIVGSHLDNTASIIVLYHVEWYCDKVF